ncbi:outer membrane beta-barrel protein [Aquimarina pacifica]|uniref:outer membrane beta-barrel protein n=1 Tax=Aquimarina pacifica TaxID=1296415 RepID=UPI000471B9C6|nr:outer membrane beta-barrel family protein [Aquimarina pacifica]
MNIFSGSITGVVIDKSNKNPISDATIILKSKTKKEIIKGGITNEMGIFKLTNIKEGVFILEIQLIGYATFERTITLSRKQNHFDVGIVSLGEEALTLEGVTIISEQSSIEQKTDRKVITIGKDLATSGTTASDIMVNLPSVDVDQNGTVSLRGNQNVRVLIDGKLTNVDAGQMLQQIPSTSIKKIELITNPSAKYNPDGMSGLINIILHKNTKMGTNGSLTTGLTIGKNARFNSALDLNHRKGKFTLYGNYANMIGKSIIEGEIVRPDDNSNEFWQSLGNSKSNVFKIGLDYVINQKNTITLYTNQRLYNTNILADTDIVFENPITNFGQGYSNIRDNNTATYNVGYKHLFSKTNHILELDADFETFTGTDLADFIFYNPDTTTLSNDDIYRDRTNKTIHLDYTNPISTTGTLEMGVQSRSQNINTGYMTTNINLYNATYEYDRTIYSTYANFSQNLKKWSYQIGVRLEYYEALGEFYQKEAIANTFEDNIFSTYPSAFLRYTPNEEDKKDTYQINFSRRVDRPGLDQINPIRTWASPRITNVGNPNLIPQFTNSIEFNYSRKLRKGSFTTAIFFRKITDEITRFAFEDPLDNSKILFSYNNYEDNTATGFEISGNYKPTSWWSFNGSFDIYSQTQKGVDNDVLVTVNTLLYNLKMNHTIKATKALTFQIVGLYRGPNKNLQYETKETYFISVGARYRFLDGKANFSINMNDIFYTRQFAFEATSPLRQDGIFKFDSRTLFLGLSYGFGSTKDKPLKRKKRDTNEKKGSGFL